eukprot:6462022-Amphidinium_carterae.1
MQERENLRNRKGVVIEARGNHGSQTAIPGKMHVNAQPLKFFRVPMTKLRRHKGQSLFKMF